MAHADDGMSEKIWSELRFKRPKSGEVVEVRRGDRAFVARFKPSAFYAHVWEHLDGKREAAGPRDLWSRESGKGD